MSNIENELLLRRRKSFTSQQTVRFEDEDPLLVLEEIQLHKSARYKLERDSKFIKFLEVTAILTVLCLALYGYYYMDRLMFHVHHGYAHMGHTSAKHLVAQHFLHGHGTKRNRSAAMSWFKQASDDGHPEASYQLAIGHLSGFTKLPKGEAHRLIHHAAAKGVEEAHKVLHSVCAKRGCN